MDFCSGLGPLGCHHRVRDDHDTLHDGVQLAVVGITPGRKTRNGVRSVWGNGAGIEHAPPFCGTSVMANRMMGRGRVMPLDHHARDNLRGGWLVVRKDVVECDLKRGCCRHSWPGTQTQQSYGRGHDQTIHAHLRSLPGNCAAKNPGVESVEI